MSLSTDHSGLSHMCQSSYEFVTQAFHTICTDHDLGRTKIGGYCKRDFHRNCDEGFITSWHASEPMSK